MARMTRMMLPYHDEMREHMLVPLRYIAGLLEVGNAGDTYNVILQDKFGSTEAPDSYLLKKVNLIDEPFDSIVFGPALSDRIYLYTLKEADESYCQERIEEKLQEWILKETGFNASAILIDSEDLPKMPLNTEAHRLQYEYWISDKSMVQIIVESKENLDEDTIGWLLIDSQENAVFTANEVYKKYMERRNKNTV